MEKSFTKLAPSAARASNVPQGTFGIGTAVARVVTITLSGRVGDRLNPHVSPPSDNRQIRPRIADLFIWSAFFLREQRQRLDSLDPLKLQFLTAPFA